MKLKNVLTSLILIITIIFIVIAYILIKNDSHYDIDKYSLTWLVVMDNKIVNDFPIFKNKEDIEYNYKGYSHTPHSTKEWNFKYYSTEKATEVLNKSLEYLRNKGFSLKESESAACIIAEKQRKGIFNYYTHLSKKGCLTLIVENQENNTLVRFYFVD